MLIYVIPLVILIIILIVVKRQDAQESDKAKTKTVKAKNLALRQNPLHKEPKWSSQPESLKISNASISRNTQEN